MLESAPLPALNAALTHLFGEEWWRLEDETLSLELALEFSELFLAKIRLLKGLISDSRTTEEKLMDDRVPGVMEYAAPRVSSDPLVLMVANDVINNREVDPSIALLPSPHELHWTLETLKALPISFTPGTMVRLLANEVCHEHGILAPMFDFQHEKDFPDRLLPHAAAQRDALQQVCALYSAPLRAPAGVAA